LALSHLTLRDFFFVNIFLLVTASWEASLFVIALMITTWRAKSLFGAKCFFFLFHSFVADSQVMSSENDKRGLKTWICGVFSINAIMSVKVIRKLHFFIIRLLTLRISNVSKYCPVTFFFTFACVWRQRFNILKILIKFSSETTEKWDYVDAFLIENIFAQRSWLNYFPRICHRDGFENEGKLIKASDVGIFACLRLIKKLYGNAKRMKAEFEIQIDLGVEPRNCFWLFIEVLFYLN
jgi:hypothetical protein